VPPGCLLGASWVPPGCLLGAFCVPPGRLLGATARIPQQGFHSKDSTARIPQQGFHSKDSQGFHMHSRDSTAGIPQQRFHSRDSSWVPQNSYLGSRAGVIRERLAEPSILARLVSIWARLPDWSRLGSAIRRHLCCQIGGQSGTGLPNLGFGAIWS